MTAYLRLTYPVPRIRILHCRNLNATILAIKVQQHLPFLRVVYDCRGAECDEFLSRRDLDPQEIDAWPTSLRAKYLTLLAAKNAAFERANAVLCVSRAMRHHFQQRYDLSNKPSAVIPCCVATDQFVISPGETRAVRRSLGPGDDFIVTYLGSLAWYQLPHESLRIFRLIKSTRPDAKFLAISTQPGPMRQAVQNAGINDHDVKLLSLAPEEVPRYLAASNIELLLRERSPINAVASPVKFGEYMAAGIPLVISHGVGDYSAAVREHQLGICIDITESNDTLRGTLATALPTLANNAIRKRCQHFAQTRLRWLDYSDVLSNLYAAVRIS